jgi:DNA polymerase elongation subunit (family B)
MRGWVLDAYPAGSSKIKLWLKEESGRVRSIEEEYLPYFYFKAGDEETVEMLASLDGVKIEAETLEELSGRREEVLKVTVRGFSMFFELAEKLLHRGRFKHNLLYNVDIPLTTRFFFERQIHPLVRLEVDKIGYRLLEDPYSLRYSLPELRVARLEVVPEGGMYTRHARIKEVRIEAGREKFTLRGGERRVLEELSSLVAELDSDIILTQHGDSKLFPYLNARVEELGVADFYLGREPGFHGLEKERSYFSYGRVYFKPVPYMLNGRVHIAARDSFHFSEAGLEGIVELSRIACIPLQRVARVTPGNVITTLQLKYCYENGILIPWKRQRCEREKSLRDLILADRGGFIFEPRVGLYDNVVELDFASMFPNIMCRHNISPETILCDCCKDSSIRVPELGYHICERRFGMVPAVVGMLVDRRQAYKRALKRWRSKALDMRQKALKWLLVTSFGYMGYRNARFGRIECHEAITAFGREILLEAASLAEHLGFEVLHGIVDSLWVRKETELWEFEELASAIEQEFGIPVDVEGRYRWIVFLPSREKRVGVINRYYGLFENGELKVRGIELRRSDLPELVRKAQQAMLSELSRASNAEEFYAMIPEAIDVLKEFIERTLAGDVSIEDLMVTVRVSRSFEEYRTRSLTYAALHQLKKAGMRVRPGELVRFLVRDNKSRKLANRVTVAELASQVESYDRQYYAELLLRAGESLLLPFGYDRDVLRELIFGRGEQRLIVEYASLPA